MSEGLYVELSMLVFKQPVLPIRWLYPDPTYSYVTLVINLLLTYFFRHHVRLGRDGIIARHMVVVVVVLWLFVWFVVLFFRSSYDIF